MIHYSCLKAPLRHHWPANDGILSLMDHMKSTDDNVTGYFSHTFDRPLRHVLTDIRHRKPPVTMNIVTVTTVMTVMTVTEVMRVTQLRRRR